MKRTSLLLAIVLVGGVLAAASPAVAVGPFMTDLVADGGGGGGVVVGHVAVSNDTDNLYVTYEITDSDWCLTATHLAVATSLDGIPQSKKGNPIPGQFEYSMVHDCIDSYTYTVPLPGGADDAVVIAAHAKVMSALDGCTETVWQIGDVESLADYPDGSGNFLTNYADEFNWAGATPYAMGPSLAVIEPAYDDPFVVGVSPTSAFPYNSNATRGYADDFDVQWDGALPFGGELIVSWSPGQSAAETKVVAGDASAVFNRTGAAVSGQGYFLDTYPVYEENPVALGPLANGTHTINFQQTKGDGTFWDWVRLVKPCERDETAWGDGSDFSGNTWATYFTYTIQAVLLETIQVPGTNATGVTSATTLESGVDYRLEASGTYQFANWGEFGIADAQCSYRDAGHGGEGWVNGGALGSANYLEVWMDGATVDWQPETCDESGHSYSLDVTGTGSTAGFNILDSCGGGTPGCYEDNSGYITVEIWWLG
jgi:hypothetical protein